MGIAQRPPKPGRRRSEPINWDDAARCMARSWPEATVAERIGCPLATLRRKLASDAAFVAQIARHREKGGQRRARLDELHDRVLGLIEAKLGEGDIRIILWLADRLKLVTPPSAATPAEELRTMVASLKRKELQELQALED